MSTRIRTLSGSVAFTLLVMSGSGCDRMPWHKAEPETATEDGTDRAGDGAATSPSEVPEQEPNDDPTRAQDLHTERWIVGSVSADDVDYFRLPAAHGEAAVVVIETEDAISVRVSTARDGAAYDVDVDRARPTRIGPLSRDVSLLIRVTGDGSYRVGIASADGIAPPCGFAREPDSRASPGARLEAVPSRVTACIQSSGDIDHFRLPAAALADLGAFGIYVSGVPGVSLQVVVRDDEGSGVVELVGGPGRPVGIPSLRSPVVGGLSVEVRSLAGANDEVPYTIELRRVPPLNGTIEAEPNDTPMDASIIDVIDIVNGYFHRPDDVDYYRIEQAEERVLRLTAEAPEGVDLQLFVEDGASFGPATIDENRAGGSETMCSIRVGPEAPFEFGVRARSVDQAEIEPYVIHFTYYDVADFEREPNDRFEQLPEPSQRPPEALSRVGIWLDEETVRPGVSGHLFPAGDVDLHLVEVFADGLAEITYTSVTLRLEANGPHSYTLELLDSDGAVVAREAARGRGENVSVSLDLPAGIYVARVSMTTGGECGEPYRLTVEQTAIPAHHGGVADPRLPVVPIGVTGDSERGDGDSDDPDAENGDGASNGGPQRPVFGVDEEPQREGLPPQRPGTTREPPQRIQPPPTIRPRTDLAPRTPREGPPARSSSEFWPGRE